MLNSAIKRLTAQRDYISRTFIAHRRSVLSPIARVPDDILFTIFDFYLQSNIKVKRSMLFPTPFTLSVVARRWRSLALSYHSPWSIISQRSAHLAGSAQCVPEPRLEVQLQRPGTSPLSVDFTGRESWSRSSVKDVVHQLLREARRWRELSIQRLEPSPFRRIHGTPDPSSFPSLRTLIVENASYDAVGGVDPMFTPLTAPLLEDETFCNLDSTSRSLTNASLPCHQLTRLSLVSALHLHVKSIFPIL